MEGVYIYWESCSRYLEQSSGIATCHGAMLNCYFILSFPLTLINKLYIAGAVVRNRVRLSSAHAEILQYALRKFNGLD